MQPHLYISTSTVPIFPGSIRSIAHVPSHHVTPTLSLALAPSLPQPSVPSHHSSAPLLALLLPCLAIHIPLPQRPRPYSRPLRTRCARATVHRTKRQHGRSRSELHALAAHARESRTVCRELRDFLIWAGDEGVCCRLSRGMFSDLHHFFD